ncbi:helix-turn-helix transcriptional regulator [Thermoflavimicrobium dichotomicum]|uniref:Putative molybdopterin biosynthesis protein n=1 Tax=Thermoflavimicrobium dichotomicum TaxID=46223 RepID=A0A1I3MY90_9BACL|nr:helix-turn-helix transcriptional regulator [Thermoflavimicrobium dichotomicum]SFJ01983.1 putative molybdopterin biosynthesis protein [Thermoflavimicrobium dichotomicum]
MSKPISYTTEEIAQILKVSKLTVYDLIKKGELPAYRVGRQMRIDAADLEAYKERAKGARLIHSSILPPSGNQVPVSASVQTLVISGQDVSLDILTRHLEKQNQSLRPLRSYVGSLNGLIAMYRGECDVVSTHLFDGETGEYNLPYIRRILVGYRFIVVNLLSRWIGFYVAKGNPKGIHEWPDLLQPHVRMVNREKGSGARVFVDEQLRLHGILPQMINGYGQEESSHLAVAGSVAKGEADVGVGIEKAALIVGVDFIPLMKERYDLVILKDAKPPEHVDTLLQVLQSDTFKDELQAIGGYNTSLTGTVLFESK